MLSRTKDDYFHVHQNKQNKRQKYHIVGTVPKSNRKIVERGAIDTLNTYIIHIWRHIFLAWYISDRWLSPGTPVSSTNKTDRHYITEIFLKVALSTIEYKYEVISNLTNTAAWRQIRSNVFIVPRTTQSHNMCNVSDLIHHTCI
jgi:hypothetical protein